MALANDDIWQKFDLFSDQKAAKHVEIELIDNMPEFSSDSLPESNTVPDINDFVFDFGQSESFDESMDFSNDSLLNSAEERFNLIPPICGRVLDLAFIDLETLESSETLRHDCMWSGLCPSEEHKHHKNRKDNAIRQAAVPGDKISETPQAARLSVFDTPIQSDLETSDLEETFSECDVDEIDVENVAALDRLVIPNEKLSTASTDTCDKGSDHTYTDHSYIAPKQSEKVEDYSSSSSSSYSSLLALLTPAQSSEDEDIQSPSVSEFTLSTSASLLKPCNKNKKGKDFMNTIKTRPPRVLHVSDKMNQNEAKFKFQMKFTSGGTSPKSRSLLRHPSRLNRTHYTKRKTAVKNSFCPSTVKQIQIQQTGVVQMGAMGARIRDGKSPKHRDKGDKCRDVRDLHNSMERQRRVDLKNAFDGLKIVIPEIADSDRASKLMILDKASDFCQSLKRKESTLNSDKDKEKRKNILLRKKLSMLQTHSNTSLQKCSRKVFL